MVFFTISKIKTFFAVFNLFCTFFKHSGFKYLKKRQNGPRTFNTCVIFKFLQSDNSAMKTKKIITYITAAEWNIKSVKIKQPTIWTYVVDKLIFLCHLVINIKVRNVSSISFRETIKTDNKIQCTLIKTYAYFIT